MSILAAGSTLTMYPEIAWKSWAVSGLTFVGVLAIFALLEVIVREQLESDY